MDEGRRTRLPVAPLVAVVVVVLLPFLYVLSIGPCGWLLAHGYIMEDSATFRLLQAVYDPLYWTAERLGLGGALDWYSQQWR